MIVRNARYKQVLPGVVGYKGNLYTKAYAKGELLFDYTNDEYETQYFTTESLEDNNTITLTIPSGVTSSNMTYIAYSTDGTNWTQTNIDSTTQTISVNLDAGDKVYWKGYGNQLASAFVTNGATGYSSFSSTKNYKIYGNLASLLFDTNFSTTTQSRGNLTFSGLFYNSANLVDCDNLVIPFETFKYGDMSDTFRGTSIVSAPKFNIKYVTGNFVIMRCFYECTSLVRTSNLKLSATSIPYTSVYNLAFYGCTSLTESPELPATTLGQYCYANMFQGCTSLVTAPELPATTLATNCYQSMFYGCTSLTTAPELPATTLVQNCYRQMFYSCTSLNYIKCLATDISATDCTLNWVYNVAPTGDFVKDPSMNSWLIDNVNGVPIGWTLHGVATYTVTLTVNDSNMGVADGAGTYSAGDQVVLRADAFTGYSFVGWYDGSTLVSSDTTYVFNIYSNISYEARFAQGGHNYANDYLTIEATEEDNTRITIRIPEVYRSRYVSFSFSKDGGTTWNTCTVANLQPDQAYKFSETINLGEKLLVKGVCNSSYQSYYEGNGNYFANIYGDKKFKAYGNALSFLYGDNFASQTTSDGHPLNFLFTKYVVTTSQNSSVVSQWEDPLIEDAKNLTLGATDMTGFKCNYMFRNCKSLKHPPILPATTLYSYCYYGMFRDCTSLEYAPVLSATTLADNCYNSMFYGCTSLTQAPILPATTLTERCYMAMFWGCTSLVNAPTLSSTNLANYCYASMFYGCTSLTQAPALPATTLVQSCYSQMFCKCRSLTQAPTLSSTTLANSCYSRMFYECTSLAQAPTLPADILPQGCYDSMFGYCTALLSAPDLIATTLGKNCYYNMFIECYGIPYIKIYAVSSSYTINFGAPAQYSEERIYYTKPNATSNILNAKPARWTLSQTL